MESITISSAAIALLSPYLAKTGEAIAKKVGEAAWEKAKEIHQAIRERFRKEQDDYPSQTLEHFERDPEKRKGAMKEALTEVLDKDPDFSHALATLLREADEAGAGTTFNVSIFGGEVGEIINVDKLEGGLTINKE